MRKLIIHLPVLVFGVLVLSSVLFWVGRSISISLADEQALFSQNRFSGVKLSRFADVRAPKMRISGTNAYATYLAEATKLVQSVRGGSAFIDQEAISKFSNVADSTSNGLYKAPILPITSEGALLGVQSVTRFKLERVIGSLAGVSHRWAEFYTPNGGTKIAYLESIDDESIARVRGGLPLGFFPTEMRLLPVLPFEGMAIYQIYNDLANVIRGGSLVSIAGTIVVLRPIPYLHSLPIANLRYLPRVGDDLVLNNESFRIEKITSVEGDLFVELDRKVSPYYISNNDVVYVRANGQRALAPLMLKISPVTDGAYVMGKDRYSHVQVVLDDAAPRQGDFIMGDQGGAKYIVDSSGHNEITIDLLMTELNALCTKIQSSEDDHQEFLVSPTRLIKNTKFISGAVCLDSVAGAEFAKMAMSFFNSRQVPDDVAGELFKERPHYKKELSIDEVYNRSMDMSLYFSCKGCTKNPQAREQLPKVYGRGEIWETYPGSLLNIYYGSMNPSRPELMIHALGAELSSRYYKDFSEIQPSFVGAANPRQFTPWLYNWHWPFFEQLLLNYRRFYNNSDFSLWFRYRPDWEFGQRPWEGRVDIPPDSSVRKNIQALDS